MSFARSFLPVSVSPFLHRRRTSGAVGTTLALAGLTVSLAVVPAQALPVRSAPASQVAVAGPAEAADIPSARLTARFRHSRVEALSERTETSQTFVNPDGTTTLEQYVAPVRIKKGDNWHDVDATLVANAGKVKPRAVPSDVVLSGGGDSDLLSLAAGSKSIVYTVPFSLPAPTLEGGTAVYADVAPGQDLIVDVSGGSVEISLRINKKSSHPVRLQLATKLVGWTLSPHADGSLSIRDTTGTDVAQSPPPSMWDSSGATSAPAASLAPTTTRTRDGADRGRHGRVHNSYKGTARDGVITATADAAFLQSPTTQYPVILDPSVSLGVLGDTFVDQSGATSNWPTPLLSVSATTRAMMSFDVSALSAPATGGGRVAASVTSATLNVWGNASSSCAAMPSYVVELNGPADTSTMWGNQPLIDNSYPSVSMNVPGAGFSAACPPRPSRSTSQPWRRLGRVTRRQLRRWAFT